MTVLGTIPGEIDIRPILPAPRLLKRFDPTMGDLGVWELNKAFAVQVL
jgi:acetyl-CoA C-acetyltransferase